MSVENEALVKDLVSWIATAPKPYAEVMEAWRTSCPRLSIWEDTVDAGLVQNDGKTVRITDAGRRFIAARSAP